MSEPAQTLLLRILLYKTTFTGHGFRSLAEREAPTQRDALVEMSRESAAEAAAIALLMREWSAHSGRMGGLHEAAEQTRTRFLQDLIALKEGMVETGLAAAMRAPSEGLRQRFLKLVDLDRLHADRLRALLGTRPRVERIESARADEGSLGARSGRSEGASYGSCVRREIDALRQAGGVPVRLVVGPNGARHLRDEALVSEEGKVFGLWLHVDMGWRGEAFAVETEERIGYAELLTARLGAASR